MKAMILNEINSFKENPEPLELTECPVPKPSEEEVLIEVKTCGVCHTELDEIEGRTPPPKLPVIPGHQVVGIVRSRGKDATRHKKGDRVGIAWIYYACGECQQCLNGNENLCENFMASGRDAHGGYAQYMTIHENFAYPIPTEFNDSEAAPLLCAGAIGYRSLRLTGLKNGQSLGLTGFGASAHLVLKMVRYKYPDSKVYVFARNINERIFAMELGAVWAGNTDEPSPEKLDAIIDTTPAWKPVVEALKNLKPAGRLIINAIRKENHDREYLLNLDYPEHLWMEKEIKSVANVERRDVQEFLQLAAKIPIKPNYREYKLEDANIALQELKAGNIKGAKVLVMNKKQ